MAEAFAGLMLRSAAPEHGDVFDARAVEQRFDVTGPGKVTLPFIVDLAERTMRWLDVTARVTGTNHAIHRHHDTLAVLGNALTGTFDARARVTLGELGRWHAAARAGEVLVRDGDRITRYRRRAGETVAGYAARIATADADGVGTPSEAATAHLQLLIRGDLSAPDGAQIYPLRPANLDASTVELLTAADLVGALDPPVPRTKCQWGSKPYSSSRDVPSRRCPHGCRRPRRGPTDVDAVERSGRPARYRAG